MEEAILWTQQQERERTEECEKHVVIGHVEFYSNSTQGVEWTRNQCRRTWGHPEQMWLGAEGSSPSAEMEHTKLFSTPHRQFWFPRSVNPCPCCLPLASKQFYTLSYQSEGFPSCLLPLRKQQTGCMVWTQVAVGMPPGNWGHGQALAQAVALSWAPGGNPTDQSPQGLLLVFITEMFAWSCLALLWLTYKFITWFI